ncbi:ATP-binding cassette, subfamily B [Granulicatella balaenopterae]|uniref:ATP-binding cassette, subfamily B n=1 Tax=Granulicatella balaenopterae TaxID=137733 RepID=A0A1H9P9J3_9LACT|nr:ABC transporter ATP-binding protein [Granulicatella balaenopterae]SER44499.1 ATP-binding cassette, subfamily B [Granulicatella balaenopterae]
MIKIMKYLSKKEWALMLVSLVFLIAQVGLDLTIPDYMSKITMALQSADSAMGDIYQYGGMMILLAFLSLFASIITALCATRIATGLAAELRELLFKKVQSFSMVELGQFSIPSLITRSTNDITQVQKVIVLGLQLMVKAPIMATWAILKIYDKNFDWTLSTGIAVVVLLVVVFGLVLACMPKFKKIQRLTDDLNRVTMENLSGLHVVRAYNAENYQESKFEQTNEAVTQTNLFTTRTMSFMMPTIQFVMNTLVLSIYWLGATLINNTSNLQGKAGLFSDMLVFSQYAIQVVMAFMLLVMIFVVLPRASVAAGRINEVLETELSIKDGEATEGLPDVYGEVEFRNVSFKYPDAEECVLRNISFTAHKGETVAFIGSTGSGKSTIINMIPRFYEATVGEVLVDGVNVKDYKQKALRNKMSYISQKSVLFSGDIQSNILYGETSKVPNFENLLASAIETAQASDFINSMEEGYHSEVAQGGENFSGGQKQRISIARGIAKNPEILIFDDSFSALDYRTDRELRKALDENCKDATRLVVAQRIGTIRDADKIIVVKDGEMVGMGKHHELMENCEEYQQIALSQLSKEELA